MFIIERNYGQSDKVDRESSGGKNIFWWQTCWLLVEVQMTIFLGSGIIKFLKTYIPQVSKKNLTVCNLPKSQKTFMTNRFGTKKHLKNIHFSGLFFPLMLSNQINLHNLTERRTRKVSEANLLILAVCRRCRNV